MSPANCGLSKPTRVGFDSDCRHSHDHRHRVRLRDLHRWFNLFRTFRFCAGKAVRYRHRPVWPAVGSGDFHSLGQPSRLRRKRDPEDLAILGLAKVRVAVVGLAFSGYAWRFRSIAGLKGWIHDPATGQRPNALELLFAGRGFAKTRSQFQAVSDEDSL